MYALLFVIYSLTSAKMVALPLKARSFINSDSQILGFGLPYIV